MTNPGIFIDGRELGVRICIELKLDSTFLRSNQSKDPTLPRYYTCFSSGMQGKVLLSLLIIQDRPFKPPLSNCLQSKFIFLPIFIHHVSYIL